MELNPKIKSILNKINSKESRPLHLLSVQEARGQVKNPYSTTPVSPRLSGNERVTTQKIDGPFGEIPIRIYTPPDSGNFPILIYFHGGGWMLGSLNGVDTICRRITQKARVIVVSVCYHLAPEYKFPDPVYEALFVTQWVYKHAKDIQGDSTLLAIGGDSAGANLAAAVTLKLKQIKSPKLCAQLLIYPITDCRLQSESYKEYATGYLLTYDAMKWFCEHYLSSPEDINSPFASPLLSVDLSGLPPAYIVTAEFDPARSDGEQYANRLRTSGVPVILRRYEGMVHDFMSFADPPWEIKEAIEAIDDTAIGIRDLLYNGRIAK